MQTATISLKGDVGKEPPIVRTKIDDIAGQVELDTFVTYLLTSITDCVLNYTTISNRVDTNTPKPGVGADVDLKAVFVVKELVDGSTHKYSIPSPKAGIIVTTPLGRRIDQAIQDGFALALSGATGNSFTAVQGYILEKK